MQTELKVASDLILSVVIPCYNEEDVLLLLYERLSKACREQNISYEIILVNDGSSDGTWNGIRELVKNDPCLVGVDLSRNHGHQLALSAGLSLCRGQEILIIDADLQDPPELLPEMRKLLQEGADVVYGQRLEREGETAFKIWSARWFYRCLSYLSETEIPPNTGDFRLMKRRVLDALVSMPEQIRFVRGMVSWVGFRQVPLRYNRHERAAGVTKYPLHKMIKLALDAITGFSIKPLRLATYFGLGMGMLTFLGGCYVFGGWLFGGRVVPGWVSLMITVLLLGSMQLVFMGILGEYVGRIFVESKRRPLFIVREIAKQ